MSQVTIAIPTYNRKEFLGQCLKSILNQTFQDFNVLIFDNHSAYNVKDFLAEFKDKRLGLMESPVNVGGMGNFIRVCNYSYDSEYVIIFHDDDVMHPQMLEREVAVLRQNPRAAFVASNLNFIAQAEKMFEFRAVKESSSPIVCQTQADLVRLILRGFNLCFDSALYRRKAVKDIAPYSAFGKWGDRPYLVDVMGQDTAVILNEPLVNYRLHAGQDSQSGQSLAEEIRYSKKLFQFYASFLSSKKQDQQLFASFTSNNILRFAAATARNISMLKFIINSFNEESRLFDLYSVTAKGYYYFAKFILRVMFI